MRLAPDADSTCSIAQALSVVGDPWSLLVVRDVAGGIHRFDDLQRELRISRRTLAERLTWLTDGGVLEKREYQQHPVRYEYHLTPAGHGLLPTLISLQDWGTRFVLGDGSLTATSAPTSTEARRVHALVGHTIPKLTLLDQHDSALDPCSQTGWTILYCFPGAFPPGTLGYPPGWGEIPGAAGCTIEATTYRDRVDDFSAANAEIRGVSTQRPDQLDAFAAHVNLNFALLSDQTGQFTAALRLPTFRAGGLDRLKRLTLVIDPDRTVRGVLYPISDPGASINEALRLLTETTSPAHTGVAMPKQPRDAQRPNDRSTSW